jgi:hypothetical protein
MIQIIAKLNELFKIECVLIIPFQLQLNNLTPLISKKPSRQVFHPNDHECVKKKHFVEDLHSFER